jgi:hypothetical protein
VIRPFLLLSCFCLGLVSVCGLAEAQDKSGTKTEDKKVDAKKDDDKKDGPVKVTAGGVTYVVLKSAIADDEKKWTLVLEATSNSGDQKIFIQHIRAVAADGKTFDIKGPMGRTVKPVSLPEGTKIQIELKMGDLPKEVKMLSRIELIGDRATGVPGFPYDRKKAGKETEPRPLVLEKVPVERPAK